MQNRNPYLAPLMLLMVVGVGCGLKPSDSSEADAADPGVQTMAVDTPLVPAANGGLEPMVEGDVKVFVFVRVDCPISNRYAPEIRRIYEKFSSGSGWWLIYPNSKLTQVEIDKHRAEFEFPLQVFHDQQQQLVHQVGATITPEVAVYGIDNQLVYCGRIDDRYIDFGKARPAATQFDLEEAIEAALNGETVSPVRQKAVGCYIADLK